MPVPPRPRTLLSLAPATLLAFAACADPTFIESSQDDAFDYVEDGDMMIPIAKDPNWVPTIAGPAAQTVFLNFGGGPLRNGGWDHANAQNNVSFIVSGSVQYPAFDPAPYGGQSAIANIVAGVRQDYAGYQVNFTTSRPTSGNYTMVMIGGRGSDIGRGNSAGVAPLDAGNSNPGDVAFVFAATMADYSYTARGVASVVAHELAHSLGLDHIQPSDAIMHPAACHCATTFKTGALSNGGGTQDDHALLRSVLLTGSPGGDTPPPQPEPDPDPEPGPGTNAPRGYLDSATCTSVTGWAQDLDDPEGEVEVKLYFDGRPGQTTSATRVYSVDADDSRADLCTALGSCKHAFTKRTPLRFREGTHTVAAFAVDAGTGALTEPTNSARTFTCN